MTPGEHCSDSRLGLKGKFLGLHQRPRTPDIPEANFTGPYNNEQGFFNAIKLNTLYAFISLCQQTHKCPTWNTGSLGLQVSSIKVFINSTSLQHPVPKGLFQRKLNGCPPSPWPLSRPETTSSSHCTICLSKITAGSEHQPIHPINSLLISQ